jgi:hypothetical protein
LQVAEPLVEEEEGSPETRAESPSSEEVSATSASADPSNNFKDDPLIQKALSAFEARVIKS